MNIREKLKSLGITRYEFANLLGVSLPTVDSYILLYENGNTIPKYKYDILFRKLFSKQISREKFIEIIEQANSISSYSTSLDRQQYRKERIDKYRSTVELIQNDMSNDDWSDDIYSFINLLISNYKINNTYQSVAEYFLFIEGLKDFKENDLKKNVLFANLFRSFYYSINNPIADDDFAYFFNLFIRECKDKAVQRETKKQKSKDEINNEIEKIINELENKGIDLTKENIINAIKSK